MTRRIMSLLAAIVLLCTMLNFGAAFAAAEEKEEPETKETADET